MRLLLDTNILVYDTVEDSDHHDEASKLIDNASEIYIPSIVIYEYIWVMMKYLGLDPRFTLLKVSEYLEDPRTVYFLESLSIIRRAFHMLINDEAEYREINDYIILSSAIEYNLPLVSFDRDLRKTAIKYGVETLP